MTVKSQLLESLEMFDFSPDTHFSEGWSLVEGHTQCWWQTWDSEPRLWAPVPCSRISAGLTGSSTPGWQPSGPVFPSSVVLMRSWAFLKSSAASVLRCWLDWHAGPRPQLHLAVPCPETTPLFTWNIWLVGHPRAEPLRPCFAVETGLLSAEGR